jgi:hypothetical protein
LTWYGRGKGGDVSTNYEIFLRPLSDDADPVSDMEAAMGIQFDRAPKRGELSALGIVDTEAMIEVIPDMNLEDDPSLPDIPYEAHPWAVIVVDLDRNQERELALADRLYEGLRVTGNYSLVLTLDGQKLIKKAVVE